MKKFSKIAVLLAALALSGATPAAVAQSRRELIRILQEQGFKGALSGDIHFTTVGTLHCPSNNFRVIHFEWFGPAHPGSHRAQYRLLFLQDGRRYVGSFVVMGGPVSIRNNSVRFTYDESSDNVITCSALGPDGSVELQDGGSLTLER